MVGATVLGVFLQGLPPDRRVAMARVASLIRRAARGVRESKRFGLVFYELNGGPLFALESREKALTLYIAEKSVITPFLGTIKGFDEEHSLVQFTDLNRLPLSDIEKIVRASVVARRERGTVPAQADILDMWGVKEEEARVAPPVVRISMRTADDEAAEAAAKAEADRIAAENKKILRPTKPEKSLVQKRQAAKAEKASDKAETATKTAETPAKTAKKSCAKKCAKAQPEAQNAAAEKPAAKKPATKTKRAAAKAAAPAVEEGYVIIEPEEAPAPRKRCCRKKTAPAPA